MTFSGSDDVTAEDSEVGKPAEPRARYIPRAFAVVAVACAVNLVIAYAMVALEHRASPPPCSGIGFGCEPGPGVAVFLWGYFFMLPATMVTLGLVLLTMIARSDAVRRRLAYGIASLYAAGALLVLPYLARD